MRRLDTDYVDILYLHNVSSRAGVLDEAMLEVANQIKESGKARFIGVSTHSNEPEVLRAAKDSGNSTTWCSPPTISARTTARQCARRSSKRPGRGSGLSP